MIKSKKLSSLVAASLILAGGSFLGVQTVSADDSTRLAAVEALASQNSGFISELTKKVDNISTTPGQLQQIDTNKADIATNKGNIAANKTDIAANQKAIDKNTTDIAKEAAARVTAVQKESTDRDEADKAEAQARDAADQKLQGNIDAEAKARADKDKEHDTDIATNKDNIAKIQKDLAASNLKDMSETAANLKNYDTQMSTVQALAAGNQKNIATNKDNIAANTKAIDNEAAARDKADQQEASERKAADSQLNKTMTSGFATIQGQQDEQDAKIGKNQKDIQTNAGKIQNNQDAIKANSDKLTNHEGRITTNESNIEANANTLHKVQGDVVDNKNAISAEAAARGDKDKEHDTAIAANKKAIGDEAAARQADISRLDNKIHDVSKEVDTVGALSMAMSGLHPLSYDEGDARFQLSAAVGTYDGTEALALGGFYHFNRDSMLSVGVATDLGADEHRMGANVGYTRRIGQGGHVSRPSEGTVSDIMKDIKNLEQKQAKLEQENEQLKQQLAALKK